MSFLENIDSDLSTAAHGVVLFGRVKPNPGADSRCVEASGATYDAAYAALIALVPEGGQLLAVARWPLCNCCCDSCAGDHDAEDQHAAS